MDCQMNDLPERLREYLRTKDPDLADRANNFWKIATPILDRQSRPDSNENGLAHVEKVELNIWRLIKDSGKESEFSPLELFLLSCAALSHDFDKGLFDKLPDGVDHGKGSGDFLRENYRILQHSFPETVAIRKIIGIHALPPEQFHDELLGIDREFLLGTGSVRLQQLAVILKSADILHTDNSRIAPLGQDPARMSKSQLRKHRAREAISGWGVDGSRIVVQAVPETEEHLDAVQGCRDFITQKEWPAVSDKLADYGFPHKLEFKIDTSACRGLESPESIEAAQPKVSSPAPGPAEKFRRTNFVFNVPYREKGRGVVGREEALAKLRNQLTTSGGSAIGQTASFHGIGGLGKTQLAVEYAYRYKDSYPHGVIWIASDQEIDPQLIQAAKKGNWISPESEHKLILEIAVRRLKTFSDCLIIFDNVEQLADIREYLPEPDANPHIILTSRAPQEGFTSIDLSLLSPELSRELLYLESGRHNTDFSPKEEDAAQAIINELGRLPLAIELAGAYLKQRKTLMFSDYLAILKKNPISVLPQQFAGFTRHEADLYRTLQISEMVFEQEPLIRDILNVLSWSGSTFMDLSLLAQLLDVAENDLLGPLSFGTDLRIFRKDRDRNRHEIHRLLRTVHRLKFPLTENREWAQSVCEKMGDWFKEKREDFFNLPAYEAEIDHLVEWQHNADTIESEHSCRLLWLQAYPPYHLGKYSKSFELVQSALDAYKQGNFDRPLLEADIRNDLGCCYLLLGNYQQALACHKITLKIREKQLSQDHLDTAISLSNIGATYGDLGDHEQALVYQARDLKICEKLLGREHLGTANSLNNIGMTYGKLRDYDEAFVCLERALKICEKKRGLEHPYTATSLDNIGVLFGYLGDHEQARTYHERALEICEKQHGPEHPDTATSLNNIGGNYRDLRNPNKALACYERALKIREQQLGPEHPDTATSLNNIGGTYSDLGYYKQALVYYEKALKICEKKRGLEHPYTISALKSIVLTELEYKRFPAAQKRLTAFLGKIANDGEAYAKLRGLQRYVDRESRKSGYRSSSAKRSGRPKKSGTKRTSPGLKKKKKRKRKKK
jgi:tetratricopeptide (TPR) repeat protein